MIRIATSRHGIKLQDDKIYSCEEDTLYKFPAPDKLNDELTIESVGGLAGKAPAFFQGYHRPNGGWTGGQTGPKAQPEAAQKTQPAAIPARTTAVATHQHPTTSTSPSTNPLPGLGGKQPLPNATSSQEKPSDVGDNKVVSITKSPTYKGFGGTLLNRAELKALLARGCGWCELTFIDIGDRYGWLDDDTAVCQKCLDGTHTKTYETPKQVSIH
jgi:hypothetical protein